MSIFDIFKRKKTKTIKMGEEVSANMAKKTNAKEGDFENKSKSKKKKVSDADVAVMVMKDKGYVSDAELARKRKELGL